MRFLNFMRMRKVLSLVIFWLATKLYTACALPLLCSSSSFLSQWSKWRAAVIVEQQCIMDSGSLNCCSSSNYYWGFLHSRRNSYNCVVWCGHGRWLYFILIPLVLLIFPIYRKIMGRKVEDWNSRCWYVSLSSATALLSSAVIMFSA